MAEKSVRRRKNAIERADRNRIVPQQMVQVSSLCIPRVLTEDFTDYALSFFLSSYILLPEDPAAQRGYLGCLYPVWVRARATSPLRAALAAVASFLLESWLRIKPDLSQSLYLQGIASLRSTLQGSEDVGDDVLMAALMLQMYENLGTFTTSKASRGLHVNGTIALVEHRRLPFSGEISQKVLLGARSQIVGRALRDSEPVPPNTVKWDYLTRDLPKTQGVLLDELDIELANLHALVCKLEFGTSTHHHSVTRLLRKATELDERMVGWADSTAKIWTTFRVSGPECIPDSVRRAGLYQEYCDIYPGVTVADLMNGFYSSRIKVQLSILICIKHLNREHYDTVPVTTLSIIQGLVDNICASIPYFLGNRITFNRLDDKTVEYPCILGLTVPDDHYTGAAAYAGYFLMARLPELLSLPVPLREGQREWIGGQMQRVMKIYNIRSQKSK